VLVQFSNIPLAEGIAYSIQPARSLSFGSQNVEYFLSALDFTTLVQISSSAT